MIKLIPRMKILSRWFGRACKVWLSSKESFPHAKECSDRLGPATNSTGHVDELYRVTFCAGTALLGVATGRRKVVCLPSHPRCASLSLISFIQESLS
jgi:hypothetical protein